MELDSLDQVLLGLEDEALRAKEIEYRRRADAARLAGKADCAARCLEVADRCEHMLRGVGIAAALASADGVPPALVSRR